MGYPLLQELRKPTGSSAFGVLDVAWPTGTKRYAYGPGVGAGPGTAAAIGHYDGKILDITPVTRGLPDRQNTLQDVEYTFSLDDSDGFFATLEEGASGRMIEGSIVNRTLVSPNLSPAPASTWWMKILTGAVIDRYQLEGPRRWQFTVRPNDQILRAVGFPRMSIDPADWPGLPTASAGQYGPIIYGQHSSLGAAGKGTVQLIPLDSTGNKFLVAWGWMKAIDGVWSNGVAKLLTTDYTISHPITNSGRLATVVTFVSAQGTNGITADLQGYEDVGDGSGSLIELAALQIKHFLVNWVFNDYKSGAWFADSTAPVDAAQFAAHAAFYPRAKGSRWILASTQGRPIDEFNLWVKTWQADVVWTNKARIGIAVPPIQQLITYMGDLHCRYDGAHRPSSITLVPDKEAVISSVSAQYRFSQADGKYLATLDVIYPLAAREAPDSLELPWSAAY